ncbi:hypothetical protein GWI34_01175 [Actinomadura sp. DSM 109109]|nr:hypothetical protein [Actinomadura lepetitiana]
MDPEGRLTSLRAEFPGWTIDGSDMPGLPYRAVREGGGEKALILGAGSYDALWTLLSQQDATDCERALLTLSKALADRGTEVIEHSVGLVMRTRAGVTRSVGALRGRFVWDSGLDLGPIADTDGAAVRIVRLIGLEMHPQLAALATRMGVRGYKVDIAAPEVTVTPPACVSPLHCVRVTCEPRPTDDDRDWFWTHMGDALAPAADVTGAEVALVGLFAADSGAGAKCLET